MWYNGNQIIHGAIAEVAVATLLAKVYEQLH
jgi:hypothetical protein